MRNADLVARKWEARFVPKITTTCENCGSVGNNAEIRKTRPLGFTRATCANGREGNDREGTRGNWRGGGRSAATGIMGMRKVKEVRGNDGRRVQSSRVPRRKVSPSEDPCLVAHRWLETSSWKPTPGKKRITFDRASAERDFETRQWACGRMQWRFRWMVPAPEFCVFRHSVESWNGDCRGAGSVRALEGDIFLSAI